MDGPDEGCSQTWRDSVKTVIAGALGECVHVAGVMNFLRLAGAADWRTVFLGPTVPVSEFLEAARRENADGSAELAKVLVGVSLCPLLLSRFASGHYGNAGSTLILPQSRQPIGRNAIAVTEHTSLFHQPKFEKTPGDYVGKGRSRGCQCHTESLYDVNVGLFAAVRQNLKKPQFFVGQFHTITSSGPI